ncbi:MAG: DUF998 domain-containing protein [Promethearchaeota archaeon]
MSLDWKKLFEPKSIGLCGMIVPFISFGTIILAIMLNSSWFNIMTDFLSALGWYSYLGPVALVFNLGLAISGALLTFFGLGFTWILNQEFKGKILLLANLSGLLVTGAGLALIVFSIFTGDFGEMHGHASMIFFSFLLFSMGVTNLTFLFKKDSYIFTIAGILIYIVFIIPMIWYMFFSLLVEVGLITAIPELISSFSFCLWLFLQSYRIYRLEL